MLIYESVVGTEAGKGKAQCYDCSHSDPHNASSSAGAVVIYNYQRAEMMAGRAGSPLLSFGPDNAQSAVAGLDNSFTLPFT